MLVKDLNGAQPVVWKPVIDYAAPDCGGADCDEIDYVPCCPTCGKVFRGMIGITNYCPECGTKLWKNYFKPDIMDLED